MWNDDGTFIDFNPSIAPPATATKPNESTQQEPEEEEFKLDDSMYVQGTFMNDGQGDVSFSQRRVKASVTRVFEPHENADRPNIF